MFRTQWRIFVSEIVDHRVVVIEEYVKSILNHYIFMFSKKHSKYKILVFKVNLRVLEFIEALSMFYVSMAARSKARTRWIIQYLHLQNGCNHEKWHRPLPYVVTQVVLYDFRAQLCA